MYVGVSTCQLTSFPPLQFKEIDELLWIFKQWTKPPSPSPRDPRDTSDPRDPSPMSRAWDGRVRQHLGVRYDSRRGCFDWDLTMKLHQKGVRSLGVTVESLWSHCGVAVESLWSYFPSLLSRSEEHTV